MMFERRIIWGLLGLLALASWSALAPGVPPSNDQPALVLTALEEAPRATNLVGAMSCSASACHGSLTPDRNASGVNATRIRRDEYLHWHDRDPHARSLKTLQSAKSLAILQRLKIIESAEKSGQWQVRKEAQAAYQNCLQCHALEPKPTHDPRDLTALEPVSCESCHGPAKTWLRPHYEESWPTLAEKPQDYIDTANPTALAQSCVACHVGAKDREVNHDLIAAGHPALKFELAAYRALLPPHWNEARLRASHPHYETELWSAGQRQSAAAAIDLLAARYAGSHATLPAPDTKSRAETIWPEFAEFDCYACHHDLGGASWRSYKTHAPKQLAAWSPWYFAAWQATLQEQPIDELGSAMQRSLRQDDERLPALLAAARQVIVQKNGPSLQFDPEIAAQHWDWATQAYLQLVAWDEDYRHAVAKGGGTLLEADVAITARLKELRALLAFEPGRDGPPRSADASTGSIDRRSQVAEQLQYLQDAIQQREAKP